MKKRTGIFILLQIVFAISLVAQNSKIEIIPKDGILDFTYQGNVLNNIQLNDLLLQSNIQSVVASINDSRFQANTSFWLTGGGLALMLAPLVASSFYFYFKPASSPGLSDNDLTTVRWISIGCIAGGCVLTFLGDYFNKEAGKNYIKAIELFNRGE